MAMTMSSNPPDMARNYTTGIMGWYDEVEDFPPQNVDSYSNTGATGVVGHYTQVFCIFNMGIYMLLECIPLNFIYFRLCGVPQKKLGVAMLLSKMRIVSTTELPQECPILR